MLPEKLTVPADVSQKLASSKGLELCDASGHVLGYFLTPEQVRRIQIDLANAAVTDEELRRSEEEGGEHSMEEVMALLEKY